MVQAQIQDPAKISRSLYPDRVALIPLSLASWLRCFRLFAREAAFVDVGALTDPVTSRVTIGAADWLLCFALTDPSPTGWRDVKCQTLAHFRLILNNFGAHIAIVETYRDSILIQVHDELGYFPFGSIGRLREMSSECRER
jgi:hypothetical protein